MFLESDVPSYGVYMLMYELLLKEFAGLGHVSSQILAGGNAGKQFPFTPAKLLFKMLI